MDARRGGGFVTRVQDKKTSGNSRRATPRRWSAGEINTLPIPAFLTIRLASICWQFTGGALPAGYYRRDFCRTQVRSPDFSPQPVNSVSTDHVMPTAAELRRDALQIWRAGVDAVLPQRLVPQWLRVEGQSLLIGDDAIPLDAIRRIVVVGGGKAGAGMAEAVETALGPKIMAEKQLTGWVNVPGGADIPVCQESRVQRSQVGRQNVCPTTLTASTCTPPGRPASTSRRPRAWPARWKSCGWSNRSGRTTFASACSPAAARR